MFSQWWYCCKLNLTAYQLNCTAYNDVTPPFSVPGSVGCPSRWTDEESTIQVDWMTPQRPNGLLLRYYLILRSFSGNSVFGRIAVDSSGALTTDFSNGILGELYVI